MGGLDHMREASSRRKIARARASERVAPLRAVNDPRDAAIILMLLIARENGDPTRDHIATVEKLARTTFGLDHDLAARMTQARFTAGRAESFAHGAALFTNLLNERLTPDEKRQLVDMVEHVAWVDGPSQAQTEALAVLSERLGLPRAA